MTVLEVIARQLYRTADRFGNDMAWKIYEMEAIQQARPM